MSCNCLFYFLHDSDAVCFRTQKRYGISDFSSFVIRLSPALSLHVFSLRVVGRHMKLAGIVQADRKPSHCRRCSNRRSYLNIKRILSLPAFRRHSSLVPRFRIVCSARERIDRGTEAAGSIKVYISYGHNRFSALFRIVSSYISNPPEPLRIPPYSACRSVRRDAFDNDFLTRFFIVVESFCRIRHPLFGFLGINYISL